ncbi:hypothetical protein HOLleu_36443 [Holothuria leucospilota]|uniref:Uncharacterized protein n=1 Tax=Holothuria leucospilota TaxID=206669 RepID=A0A9Q0YLX9_HOLLE|nr:hypothetical protein HOLleu_36443 [Holothuria leucospilota]
MPPETIRAILTSDHPCSPCPVACAETIESAIKLPRLHSLTRQTADSPSSLDELKETDAS